VMRQSRSLELIAISAGGARAVRAKLASPRDS
jgi:hypothetical protein